MSGGPQRFSQWKPEVVQVPGGIGEEQDFHNRFCGTWFRSQSWNIKISQR